MVNESNEAGIAAVIIERLETQRLPRALELKAKVDRGEVLDDFDIDFLDRVFADTNELRPLLARHPEHQGLAARVMDLYHDITAKALANEPRQP